MFILNFIERKLFLGCLAILNEQKINMLGVSNKLK